MSSTIEIRLNKLEAINRRLIRVVAAQALTFAVIVVTMLVAASTPVVQADGDASSQVPQSLTVSELIVVDDQGTERVRIGSDFPDAVIDGKRVQRGTEVAGVMLYDTTGQERSGYVTSTEGNVFLTLDTRQGQVALFAAGPDEGSTARLWHDNDAVELRSDSDGSRITAIDDGRVVFQRPIATLGEEACTQYQAGLQQFSRERIMDACRQRFTGKACTECLRPVFPD